MQLRHRPAAAELPDLRRRSSRKATIARWSRTLSTMFAAGVPLVESLDSVAGAVGQHVYDAGDQARSRPRSRTGTSLTIAMTNTQRVPEHGAADDADRRGVGLARRHARQGRRLLRAGGRRRGRRAVQPDGADHHGGPGRPHRRPRGRHVPADLQAGPGRSDGRAACDASGAGAAIAAPCSSRRRLAIGAASGSCTAVPAAADRDRRGVVGPVRRLLPQRRDPPPAEDAGAQLGGAVRRAARPRRRAAAPRYNLLHAALRAARPAATRSARWRTSRSCRWLRAARQLLGLPARRSARAIPLVELARRRAGRARRIGASGRPGTGSRRCVLRCGRCSRSPSSTSTRSSCPTTSRCRCSGLGLLVNIFGAVRAAALGGDRRGRRLPRAVARLLGASS